MFDSVLDAYDATIYIDNRSYVVNGVLSEMGTVSSGISPDEAIFIPYETGIKYITGKEVSPTITVVAGDVDQVDTVMERAQEVLAESYGDRVEFTISDAGSKMEAASKSNQTLTLLLMAMAIIVFIVGGIGIMNVLQSDRCHTWSTDLAGDHTNHRKLFCAGRTVCMGSGAVTVVWCTDRNRIWILSGI